MALVLFFLCCFPFVFGFDSPPLLGLKVFYPAIPNDLSIGFSVNGDRLLVSVHGLHTVTTPITSPFGGKHRERANTVAAPTLTGKVM